jgi:hypothetical protein
MSDGRLAHATSSRAERKKRPESASARYHFVGSRCLASHQSSHVRSRISPPEWFYRVRLREIALAARPDTIFFDDFLAGRRLMATKGGRDPTMGSRPCQVTPRNVARALAAVPNWRQRQPIPAPRRETAGLLILPKASSLSETTASPPMDALLKTPRCYLVARNRG